MCKQAGPSQPLPRISNWQITYHLPSTPSCTSRCRYRRRKPTGMPWLRRLILRKNPPRKTCALPSPKCCLHHTPKSIVLTQYDLCKDKAVLALRAIHDDYVVVQNVGYEEIRGTARGAAIGAMHTRRQQCVVHIMRIRQGPVHTSMHGFKCAFASTLHQQPFNKAALFCRNPVPLAISWLNSEGASYEAWEVRSTEIFPCLLCGTFPSKGCGPQYMVYSALLLHDLLLPTRGRPRLDFMDRTATPHSTWI